MTEGRVLAAVAALPAATRAQVYLELEADPAAWSWLRPLLLSPDPARAADLDMKRAVANEADPRSHPEARGRWADLRRFVQEAVRRAAGAGGRAAPAVAGLGALGQFDVWGAIGSAVSSIGTAASSVYMALLKDRLQRAQLAAEQRAREAEAQRQARERAAAEAALRPPAPGAPAAPPGAPAHGPPAPVAGMPWYLWAAVLAAVAGGGFLALRALRG